MFGADPPRSLIEIDENRASMDRESYSDDSVPPTPTIPTSGHGDRRGGQDVATFSSDFRERRRRAEKLSRFFGVAYQNIDLITTPPVPPTPEVKLRSQDVRVDVSMAGRQVWAYDGHRKPRQTDETDVRDKLRMLKAA